MKTKTKQNEFEQNQVVSAAIERITITAKDLERMMDRYHYSEETRNIIQQENLLPTGLLTRLHSSFPGTSGIMENKPFLFTGKTHYQGLEGFREIVEILNRNGIDIKHIPERECFIEVYRFLATKHVLNKINWQNFADDSLFQLVIPQPGMIPDTLVKSYVQARDRQEKELLIKEYQKQTNPHDGKQLLNKPWYINEEGGLEILQGSQHKYPSCQLIFDSTTQNCFTFCTYCFRHAQVRGDEDMFVQEDLGQVLEYLRRHKEVTDVLITGGDAGFITPERLEGYAKPMIEDETLMHIRSLRLGTRALTFHPEMVLSQSYDRFLQLFRRLVDHGIQVVWMAHFSTPREVLNPSTIAAIRRLKQAGVMVKSQSPIMNHISLFTDDDGRVDLERSAQNWIDLGQILAMLGVGFHSMYCARPTGEHHYFTAPLAAINQVFSKVYRTLSSISRPSRYITMTSSGGKVSLLGTTEVHGEKAFVLKFNQGRNMEWADRVFLAHYDEQENTIEKLKPFSGDRHFYEDELAEIEQNLDKALKKQLACSSKKL